MILMVVDGQGGGIGATIIKRLRDGIGHETGRHPGGIRRVLDELHMETNPSPGLQIA